MAETNFWQQIWQREKPWNTGAVLGTALQVPGEAMDSLDRAVNIPGTKWSVYDARHSIIDPLVNRANKLDPSGTAGVVTNIASEMLIPDSTLYFGKLIKGAGKISRAVKGAGKGRQLAGAMAGVGDATRAADTAGDFKPSNVFQHSSDTRLDATSPRNWGEIKRASEAGDITTTKALLKESSPYYSTLAKRNKVITIDQVAKDKDLILQLADRNTGTAKLFTDYVHATVRGETKKAQVISRTLNDFASKNPFDPSDIIYGNKGIRDSLKNAFVEFTGQEWHHIFGNKEIGEAMLTKLAGEPMMAANIFKFLQKNKIPTSGIASNMGLASKAKHTGRGQSIHQWMKEFGLEPWTHPKLKGGDLDLKGLVGKRAQDLPPSKRVRKYQEGKFTAPLDLGDHLKAISKEVLAGNTEADEFIDILRSYGKFRDKFLLKKLKEFDMRIVSEIEGTERVILDKLYKPTIGTRGRKAR